MNKMLFALGLMLWIYTCDLCAGDTAHTVHLSTQNTAQSLINAARARTQKREFYDGTYRVIAYPNGDVADNLGVCSDLIIRAYRAINIDLQVLVHEDISGHFPLYPKLWQLKKPDSNIDHRRVPNLQRFFERHHAALPVSKNATDYKPGDLVTWLLPGNLPHIGLVSDQLVPGTQRPNVMHNIGAGPVEDDSLFSYTITGHYRFRL
ncbi:MAG TPA: DUF1287 domain-containing protein [Cellvibrionaceae bacterium]